MWETLRKFGLSHCDLSTMMWNINSMLRILTLNIDPRNERPIPKLLYIGLIIACLCYYYVYLVSMSWFVFWKCRQTGDLLAAIIVFSLGISSEISMTKFIWVFVNRKSVRKIVSSYLACDDQVSPGSRFAVNLQKTLRQVKKRAIIVWNVIVWNGIIYIILPIVRPGRHQLEDVFVFFGLEPMEVTPNHEIAYSVSAIGVYVTCYPAANISSLFIILAGYTEAQMLALSEDLTNLWDDALKYCQRVTQDVVGSEDLTDLSGVRSGRFEIQNEESLNNIENATIIDITDNNTMKQLNEYIRMRLKQIVKVHMTNIILLREIENVFRGALAIEFMLLITGIIAELLGGLEKTYIELPFALIAVGTDCLTGQHVKDASVVFEKAVYDSKWENFDVENRKIILLMLRNSQRSMRLSAGGVATLDLECLMAVLRTTYSAYTTLRSTMK